jgi:hypothetical protein
MILIFPTALNRSLGCILFLIDHTTLKFIFNPIKKQLYQPCRKSMILLKCHTKSTRSVQPVRGIINTPTWMPVPGTHTTRA